MGREHSRIWISARQVSLTTTQALAALQHRARLQALGIILLASRGDKKRGKEVTFALVPNIFCVIGE